METSQQIQEARETLNKFNELAKALNLPGLVLVNPRDCVGQEKNARYFSQEVYQQLLDNVKSDGRLESVPLLYPHESEAGKYRIISGHHRVQAAIEAGLQVIIAFVITPENKDEIISKQLSHNSLVGKDDKMILKELYNEIEALDKKMAAGIQFELDKIDYASLSFKVGSFKELLLLFIPEEIERMEKSLEEIEKASLMNQGTTVIIANIKNFDHFAETLRRLKKAENIKSNPMAVLRMVEIADEWLARQREIEPEKGKNQKKQHNHEKSVIK